MRARAMLEARRIKGMMEESDLPSSSRFPQLALEPVKLLGVHISRIKSKELHQTIAFDETVIATSSHVKELIFALSRPALYNVVIPQSCIEPDSIFKKRLVGFLKPCFEKLRIAIRVYVVAQHQNKTEAFLLMQQVHLPADFVLRLFSRPGITDNREPDIYSRISSQRTNGSRR